MKTLTIINAYQTPTGARLTKDEMATGQILNSQLITCVDTMGYPTIPEYLKSEAAKERILLSLTQATITTKAANELILNGTFSNGLTNWEVYTGAQYISLQEGRIYINDIGHTMAIVAFQQHVTVQPNTQYRINFEYHLHSHDTIDGGLGVDSAYYISTGDAGEADILEAAIDQAGHQQITNTFTTPGGVTDIWFMINIHSDHGWITNVSMTKVV